MSVLLKNGRIVTAVDDYVADIFVADEQITRIGRSLDLDSDRVIDAAGKYIIPGGIDPHTHLEMPFGGVTTADDFTSGTVAAGFGGTTTIIDFCLQKPGETFADALATWHEKIDHCKPVVDVGFHLAITDLKEGGRLEDLPDITREGVTSYKLFMAYPGVVMVDDETLFKTMRIARQAGALVMVHAENGYVIDALVKAVPTKGLCETRWHAATRPPLAEAEATSRAIYLAAMADAPLYVVHVSCREAIEPIAAARAAGRQVWGETCPQYLLIDETALDRPDFEGAKYVFTPPPRPKEHQDELWRALALDTLSVVSTDHAPFDWRSEKARGKDDFTRIPNGAPGIEERLQLLHHFGVRPGRISMRRFVDITSTTVARLFGLYPRKGTVAVGSDADLVVWNPDTSRVLSVRSHQSKVDYNTYEGTEVRGTPEIVMLRGRVVVERETLVASPGVGQFIKRKPFDARTN